MACEIEPERVDFCFRRECRLVKTDEFSSVFTFRRKFKSSCFELIWLTNNKSTARLGIVVGKKFAPSAVVRNLIKRVARESFRHMRSTMPSCDLILRLRRPFFLNKREMRREINYLLERLCNEVLVD